jgi:hypothetical protein
MEIDIRHLCQPILKIKFNDRQRIYIAGNNVMVEGECVAAKIPKTDVENLIKALQKAVELGWTK